MNNVYDKILKFSFSLCIAGLKERLTQSVTPIYVGDNLEKTLESLGSIFFYFTCQAQFLPLVPLPTPTSPTHSIHSSESVRHITSGKVKGPPYSI